MSNITSLKDKFEGCVVGAAIGDALGMPTESISRNEHILFYGGRVEEFRKALSRHPCAHLKEGQYTDDTQQFQILGNSLVKHTGFNFEDFAKEIGNWGYRCKLKPGYDRFSGSTSLFAALDIHHGKNPRNTGRESPSCGAAMRAAPIGLFYFDDPAAIERFAREASILTHIHPTAVDSAVYVSRFISRLLKGSEPNEAAQKSLIGLDKKLSANLSYVISNSNETPQKIAEVIGASQAANETVPMAVSCFLHSPNDFKNVIVEAANLVPGDTDSIACIAGAFAGAYNGYQKIPAQFKEGLEEEPQLRELAANLLEKSLTSSNQRRQS